MQSRQYDLEIDQRKPFIIRISKKNWMDHLVTC